MKGVAGMGMRETPLECSQHRWYAPSLLNRLLRDACGTGSLVARARSRLRELDAVQNLEECLGAGFHDVRTDARAPVGPLIVLHVHDRLALRVLALGHAAHLEFAQHDVH